MSDKERKRQYKKIVTSYWKKSKSNNDEIYFESKAKATSLIFAYLACRFWVINNFHH